MAASSSDTALDEVFALAVEDLAPLVAEKGVEVRVGPPPSLRRRAGQMYAVARNLLANAIDSPGTPPRVEVAADRLDGRWRVEVTDNGVGVAPDQRETMFVLFARADKRSGGSGSGWPPPSGSSRAHGGRIGLDAAPGGGTTVCSTCLPDGVGPLVPVAAARPMGPARGVPFHNAGSMGA